MRCILCNSDSVRKTNFKQVYPQANAVSIKLDWFECSSCDGLFNYPHPTPEEIGKYWQTVGYNDPQKEDLYLQEKKSIYNKIMNIAGHRNQKILDFGSNFGQFLDLAKSYGWQTFGFEPNEEAVRISEQKGHHMYTGFEIEHVIPKDELFNVIVANDSFYYVWNPYNTLLSFHKLLEKDGMLIMRISNKRSIIKLIDRFYKDGNEKDRLVSKILQAQFHSIHVNALKKICLKLGYKKVDIKIGANTSGFRQQSLFTNLSYITSSALYYATFCLVNVSPGVLFIAKK